MIPDEWLVSTVPPRVKIGRSVIGLIGVIHVASPKCVFDTWLTFSHCLLIIFNAYLFSQWQFIHINDNKVSIFCRNKTSADGYFAESLSGDLLNTRKICFIRRLFPPHKNRDCVPARASPETLRFSRPSARATAAIREMNKLAESFSFCWVLRTPTAAHSIRIKLAILAIPADLLATQQLPQRFSGDVHKNEMGLCKAVKKKKKRERKKIPYIKSGCSSRAMAAKSWLNGGWVRPPVVSD